MTDFVDACLKYESDLRKTSHALGASSKKFLSKSKGAAYIKKKICDKMAAFREDVSIDSSNKTLFVSIFSLSLGQTCDFWTL